jgi:prophage antirepressor-like protein
MTALKKITSEFEGKTFTTLNYKGRTCWIAAEVGQALNYSQNGSRLVTNITREWADEFIPGHDHFVLKGQKLADFKVLFEPVADSVNNQMEPVANAVDGHASHLLLLFEPGLYLCLAKTNKPIGRRLRRFLADEILPQLVRDEQYSPGREVVNNELVPRNKVVTDKSAALLREQRLTAWQRFQMQKAKSESVKEMLATLKSMNRITDDAYAAYTVIAAEMETEQDFGALKPEIKDDAVVSAE